MQTHSKFPWFSCSLSLFQAIIFIIHNNNNDNSSSCAFVTSLAITGYTLNYLKIDCNLILAQAIEMRLLVRRRLYKRFNIQCTVFWMWWKGEGVGWLFKTFPKCKNYLQQATWSQYTHIYTHYKPKNQNSMI